MALRNVIESMALAACLAFGASGCSSDDADNRDGAGGGGGSGGQSGEEVVEIFSWWIAPGEAEALQALVDLDKVQHPNARVYNAAADSGSEARALLAQRLEEDRPPDLFQQNAHDIRSFLQANPEALEPLDDFFAEQGLDEAINPDVLGAVTVDGSVYAMPVNVHRENGIFYNKQIFQDHGLEPPTTLEEFLSTCATLKAEGVTPVATAYQGWILRIMFNTLAMGSMGAEAFHDFMEGDMQHEPAFRDAVDVFAGVLDEYINADAGETDFGWTNAAEAVSDGNAAMFLHGDWAKGYYVQLGWTPGVDFGVIAAPGASEMFWYGVDVFSLPVGAPNRQGALDFLQTVGSLEGQTAFNRLKGSTPVRGDVPRQDLDSEGRTTLDEFLNARYRMRVVNKDIWDQALLDFATARDTEALITAYLENPPGQ